MANHAFGLFELAALHLSLQPPQLPQARLAIDALAALVDGLGDRLGDAHPQLSEGLSQLRMAYVQIHRASQSADGDMPTGRAGAPTRSGPSGPTLGAGAGSPRAVHQKPGRSGPCEFNRGGRPPRTAGPPAPPTAGPHPPPGGCRPPPIGRPAPPAIRS